MKSIASVRESLLKARYFTLAGGEQILEKRPDDVHRISPCAGATALAVLALLSLGAGFEAQCRSGINWLNASRTEQGWGRIPAGEADPEINYLVQTVLLGNSGVLGKLLLLSRTEELSNMVLSLGQKVVPGLQGPEPDEIHLPRILEDKVLQKLPGYGHPVVIAASILAAPDNNKPGIKPAVEFLYRTQMADGSWSEDIVSTSLAVIALFKTQGLNERLKTAGSWLASKQYDNGAWAAFDQLHTWSISWMINIYNQFARTKEEERFRGLAAQWLQQAQNSDGSYGGTPPYTHPDLDDTAVALQALQTFKAANTEKTANLLAHLQNKDGSWSTFPSFLGTPPDITCQSPVYIPSLDVTVHVLEALGRRRGYEASVQKGVQWLLEQQLASGEFPAVWFEGPIYGAAQALELIYQLHYSAKYPHLGRQAESAMVKALNFLLSQQKEDGSWGVSVIETSMALSGLCRFWRQVPRETLSNAVYKILSWQLPDGSFQPSYQGIYAKGWNYEEPITTALTAIQALERYRAIKR